MMVRGDLLFPEVNENELRARLGCPTESVSLIPKCVNELKKCVKVRFICRFCDVKRTQNGIDLGFGEIISKNLIKNLGDCERAAFFAVTLGSEVDRLLIKLGKLMPSEQFVTDAIASALASTAWRQASPSVSAMSERRGSSLTQGATAARVCRTGRSKGSRK